MLRIDIDQWEEILTTITRNKTRSLLTAFGVFWGIFMLVILLGGGQGVKHLLSATFSGFATNSAFFVSAPTGKAYKGFQKGRRWELTIDDVEKVRKAVPELEVVTSSTSLWGGQVEVDGKKSDCLVRGLYPDYEAIEAPNITWGRFINDMDIRERRKVCVIGKRVHRDLFSPDENPCGKYIHVNGIRYRIVGVSLSTSNLNINGTTEESVTLPFTTMQLHSNTGNYVDLICTTARPGYKVSELTAKVEGVLKQAHLIHPDDKQAVMTINAEAMFSMVDNLFTGINILAWMVGLGTLLAGAIGVSNIMMVTVKERTTEIGIRRAIGARPRDILYQILAESMVLTTVAGLSGISFGVIFLNGMEWMSRENEFNVVPQFQISFGMALGACGLLLLLGTLAGLAPAYRAMAIRPIEAIRDE